MAGKTFNCLTKNHFLSQRGSTFTNLISSTVITSRSCHGVQNAWVPWHKFISKKKNQRKKKISECSDSFNFDAHIQRNYMLPRLLYKYDGFLYLPHHANSNIALPPLLCGLGVNCGWCSNAWSQCWFTGLLSLPCCFAAEGSALCWCCASRKIVWRSLQSQTALCALLQTVRSVWFCWVSHSFVLPYSDDTSSSQWKHAGIAWQHNQTTKECCWWLTALTGALETGVSFVIVHRKELWRWKNK